MKALTFIRQRSFARYITIDLTTAARRVGWNAQWLDLEGRLYETANVPIDQKLRVIAGTLVDIEQYAPDVVVSYGLEYLEPVFQSYVPGFDTRFRELVGAPAVYLLCDFGYPFDAPTQVKDEFLVPLQQWDSLVLCWDRDATAALKDAGLSRARYFPLAVNDEQFFEAAQPSPEPPLPVVFVGGPTTERVHTLEAVADLGLTIHGYDPAGWLCSETLRGHYRGEILDRNRLRDVYQRSNICINVTRPHGVSSLNMRAFEAMACGSLMVTDDRSDAGQLFEDGREIIIYRDQDDLRRKVEYYLAHEDERHQVATAGRRRILDHHTYRSRLTHVDDEIREFARECKIFRHLTTLIERDPAQAVRFTQFITAEEAVTRDRESLRLLECRARASAGDTVYARDALDELLQVNPRHREARLLRRELRDAA